MNDWKIIDFYTQYHPRWFESPSQYEPSNEYVAIYSKIIPDSWELKRMGIWYVAKPPHVTIPEQGWKIHISVSTKDSEQVLRQTLQVLRKEKVWFKFLIDSSIVASTNGKLWPRGSSGKFITIYPISLDQFYRLGNKLSSTLSLFSGPYILSDRRWPPPVPI